MKEVELEELSPAFILFTSGSTGQPKGVTHSHKGAFNAIQISQQALDIVNQDVVLVGKPISHAGGLQTQLMPALLVGAEVILSMKPTPASAVALIKQFAVSEYGMLASDLLDFIEYLEQNPCPLPSLKNGIGSGDAVPVDLHHRFKDIFNWELLEGCGMTEIGCYYAMNPRYEVRKWGSMGKPCPNTQISIINEQGETVSQGKTGEIIVKSPSSTIGYWQDEESTQQLFNQGWLYTGDLAYQDEQGYLWFVGRKKLMIVRRGSNISPVEVENIIDEHPLVHASVVVSYPDNRDGHVPVAFVTLLNNTLSLTSSELDVYVKSRLAAYKTPAHYLFLEELPRNATGKFDRHHLEELAVSMVL
ncbi:class I adenylate-forming enzyme family protein [Methyloprofundus sp.]|uniref:class I adenylate-forming enzyme family protein n=1 Tax=Methyloprofundus sp. TaxID=2020875 RepID=UPI003D0B7E17